MRPSTSLQRRALDGAARHRVRAARVEAAAGRRVERARHLARQHDLLAPLVGMARQGRREQRLRCRDASARGASACASPRLDDLAEIHHRDLVAHVRDRGEIVGDEQVGQAEPRPAGRAAGSGSARGSTRRAPRPARPARPAAATATSARAIAMRWRWPPENSCGKRSAERAGRPTRSSSSQHALAHRVGASTVSLVISGSAMMAPTRMRGLSEAYGSWNTACTDLR